MSARRLRAVLVGFGRIAHGYANDRVMARYVVYASHSQVLAEHPAFDWDAVVDPSPVALDLARRRWGVRRVARHFEELGDDYSADVAIIATPPTARLEVVERVKDLRGVLVEKPLGRTVAEAKAFLAACEKRDVAVQVNLVRRADAACRTLAQGRMAKLVGAPQGVFAVYGNGLLNNGTHMVDLARMLCGEMTLVQAVSGVVAYREGPLEDDVQLPFTVRFASGVAGSFLPLRFDHYRENGLEVWGEKGRLSILQEGLRMTRYPVRPNRAMRREKEIASDQPHEVQVTLGRALYDMYSNLAGHVTRATPLFSPGVSALKTSRVMEAALESSRRHGRPVALG